MLIHMFNRCLIQHPTTLLCPVYRSIDELYADKITVFHAYYAGRCQGFEKSS